MNPRHLLIACAAAALFAFVLNAESSKSMKGQNLPPLTLEFPDGKIDVKGKPVILEFWATWCAPCRKGIPHLNALYKKYKSQGLEIIGITKEDEATVKSFLKKTPIDYPIAYDSNRSFGQQFSITGIPHTVLVNKEGKIVWEGDPTSVTEKAIEDLLK